MKQHRGFTLVHAAIVLVALALIAAIVYGVKSYVEGEREAGFQAGMKDERAKWLSRESKELAEANAEINRLHARAAELEQQHAAALAKAGTDFERRIANERKKNEDFAAGLRTGRIGLRDPGARPAACPESRPDPGPDTAAATAGGDGAGGAQLSAEASQFLWGEAGRADDLAEKLTFAQAVIVAYYETCRAAGTP